MALLPCWVFACGYKMRRRVRSNHGHQAPLKYIFYIAGTRRRCGKASCRGSRTAPIFSGAELQADFKPGGLLAWVGAGSDGKPMTYVRGKVLRFEPPKVFSTPSQWAK